MIELSLVSGRPFAELIELEFDELATLVEVLDERGRHG